MNLRMERTSFRALRVRSTCYYTCKCVCVWGGGCHENEGEKVKTTALPINQSINQSQNRTISSNPLTSALNPLSRIAATISSGLFSCTATKYMTPPPRDSSRYTHVHGCVVAWFVLVSFQAAREQEGVQARGIQIV